MRTVKIVLASCMALVCGMTIANERNNEIRKSPEYRAALARGALASLRIQIVDDENNVVPYARVKVSFDMTTHQIAKIQDADASGLCFVEGLTRGNSVVIVVEKDGYYSSKREQCLVGTAHAHGVKNGRWMPSPIDEKITLRKIRHPVDIVRERRIVDMPATNVWVGFDMRVSDFVKPNGGGGGSRF